MKPTLTLLIGFPLSGDEARFLETLHADLADTGALILANFVVGEQQIDFVVVTPTYAALIELKNFPRPIFGDRNGWWKHFNAAGQRVQYTGMNPWQQTRKQKYALSDAMKAYQAKTVGVPGPSGKGFFSQFAAYVCVYPRIHQNSEVTPGDHIVEVQGYGDVLEAIRNGAKPSTWTLTDWHTFAERHLQLSQVTLADAIDSRVLDAHLKIDAYCERIATILSAGLPPLVNTDGAEYGVHLIDRLVEPHNYQLIGPAGSAKSFHLRHLAIAIASGRTELPIFLQAAKYSGGEFWTFVRHNCAPFFKDDPRVLMEATTACALRSVLLVDALNECPEALREQLLKGLQAFALRFDGRVVVTSQQHVDLVAELKADAITLPTPDQTHKRAIYAHHASIAPTHDLDRFCEAFANAYDLTIAGRCHAIGPAPRSRADLYDRYVRRWLPHETAVATALLRRVAAEMSRVFTVVWPRNQFESFARAFLTEQKVSLSLLDEIENSRLVRISEDSFAFEHELLLDYFRADHLREQATTFDELVVQLRRPRNHDALEFLLPRFSNPTDLDTLLSSINDVGLLSAICRGDCGRLPQDALILQCQRLFERAAEDTPRLHVTCVAFPKANGRTDLGGIEVKSEASWNGHDAALCDVIALNLEHPRLQSGVLDLLDLTEWTLRSAVHSHARGERDIARVVWGEAVRLYGGILQHGALHVPCTAILAAMRLALMRRERYANGNPIRTELVSRAAATPASDFALVMLFEDRTAAARRDLVAENLDLVQRGLRSPAWITRMHALQYLESMHQAVHDSGNEHLTRVRTILDTIGTNDLMVNSAVIECLLAYGQLELAVTPEDALSELKAILAPGAVDDPTLIQVAALSNETPAECLAERAYGALSRIFEEVFQWVYLDAYGELSPAEKREILSLAAQARHFGFLGDWILGELRTYADVTTLPIYRRHASSVNTETGFAGEAVATFVLALEGCARWSDAPPAYRGGMSSTHEAWAIVGEILFWCFRRQTGAVSESRLAELWSTLTSRLALPASDVLYQLSQSEWRMRDRDRGDGIDLVQLFPAEVRRIVDTALLQHQHLSSVFQWGGSRDANGIRYLIGIAATLGNSGTIQCLEHLVDHEAFGAAAITAIEAIKKAETSAVT